MADNAAERHRRELFALFAGSLRTENFRKRSLEYVSSGTVYLQFVVERLRLKRFEVGQISPLTIDPIEKYKLADESPAG
jgi:hypothetical protein